MGQWKVGEWTEVGNINRGKMMKKAPIRGPQGVAQEVGVFLVETQ